MATKRSGPNKSAFIRGILEANAQASIYDVNVAWKESGNADTLTPTLFYQMRSQLGLGGRKRKKNTRANASAPETEQSDPGQAYLKIEQQLDTMIAEATELRDSRLAESLRDARRRASVRLV